MDETDRTAGDDETPADVVQDRRDMGASVASGSFQTDGMLVAPGSIKPPSSIANNPADKLLPRAADVRLKARRQRVLKALEMPLYPGHLVS